MKAFSAAIGLAIGCAAVAASAYAASGIETRPIQFARGASSATIKGTLKGDQIIDYVLRARAGQSMEVRLEASNGATYFNLLPPGSSDEAIFIGQTEGNQFRGKLPADGEYKVRLYLMRSAARRGESSHYTLTVGITGQAAAAPAPAAGAAAENASMRAGAGKFDATGRIPCAMQTGQPMASCEFGVAREGGGTATVAVTRPDGRKRFIFFEKGKATSADLSQADGDMTFRARKQSDLNLIEAGRERYEIPDAVVFGG